MDNERRELTEAQAAFVALLNNPENRAKQRLLDEQNRRDAEAARKVRDEQLAKQREAERIKAAAEKVQRQPLIDALRAAGIQLSTSNCGCCGGTYVDFELPDGTKGSDLNFEINTFDEE